MNRLLATVAVLLLACWSTSTTIRAADVVAAAGAKPNIVVILADDFGWGSASCYGASGVQTPNIDRIAKEGRLFMNAYAPGSVCSPTRYGIMTGRYYWRTSVKDGKVLPVNAPLHIEPTRLTLASLCRGQGYKTAAFGKWHLGMTEARVTDWKVALKPGPLQVGFNHFFGMAANIGNGPQAFIENEQLVGADDKTAWPHDRVMESITAKATGWIEQNHAQPFFVYFAPNAVHEPIVPSAKFTGSPLGKYGDFIRELDWSVGQILDTLDRLKLADDTLLIFTSDNGGVVNPNNADASAAMKAGLKINGPLRGGKHSEWEGGFREPFLVRWPGKTPAKSMSNQVICLTDLLATFAGIQNVPLTKGNAEDSFDVSRAFTERAAGAPVRDPVILQAADATYAIRVGEWKFIERADPPKFESTRNARKAAQAEKKRAKQLADELYNLKGDPYETKDVMAGNEKRAAAMKKLLVASRDRGYTRPGAGNE
jgi:arylsulfatase A-like enzyme